LSFRLLSDYDIYALGTRTASDVACCLLGAELCAFAPFISSGQSPVYRLSSP
jgi:hypothetical protein